MNYKTIRAQEDKALEKLGEKFGGMYKGRVCEILRELSKDFNLKGLIMGMGDWTFTKSTITVFDPDDRDAGEWEVDADELIEHGNENHGYLHKVVGLKERHKPLLREFSEIMEHLSDPDCPCPVFNLTAPF